MAAAVRNTRSSTGTRRPIIAMMATAKAVSVAIGTPQPCCQGPAGINSRYSVAGTTMPPSAAAIGNAAERRCAEPADGEFALDLQANDQEENGQQRVVDPVRKRHFERMGAKGEAQRHFPQRGKGVAQRGVDEAHRQQRHRQQHQARGRCPPCEVQGGRLHAVTERTEHRLRQRHFVPRALVASAIDEEGRRCPYAALRGTGNVGVHSGTGGRDRGRTGRQSRISRQFR